MLKALFATAAFVVAASQPARGTIVFRTFVDLNGTGLGAVNTILTLTSPGATTTESGCVAFGDVTGAPACFGTGNTGGDEQTGASQTRTRTIAQSGATSAAAFVLVFNAVEPSGNSITLDSLSVRFYSPTGSQLYTASLAAPVQFPNTEPGTGNAGFVFVLDNLQAAQAQAAGAFNNPANVIGLSAGLSDATGGHETFFVASRPAVGVPFEVEPEPIPEPSTYLTLGAGLLMLGFSRRRLVHHRER
jgi:hypothetical protein